MENVFENLMIGLFCCAIAVRLIQHIFKKTYADFCERFTLFTIGIGFIIGTFGAHLADNQWSAILHCLGAYLTCVTLLFSWPSKMAAHSEEAGRNE